ncbi:MAG: hypothetical protein OXE57_09685, partial [Alphaproteobacteria bacterium]|nr:hypothetical protein [Alphaproteobacteria bacterium]
VRRHVYAVELDPTDREELFGSQAAGSAGPPENLDLLAHARASSPVMRLIIGVSAASGHGFSKPVPAGRLRP